MVEPQCSSPAAGMAREWPATGKARNAPGRTGRECFRLTVGMTGIHRSKYGNGSECYGLPVMPAVKHKGDEVFPQTVGLIPSHSRNRSSIPNRPRDRPTILRFIPASCREPAGPSPQPVMHMPGGSHDLLDAGMVRNAVWPAKVTLHNFNESDSIVPIHTRIDQLISCS
jgi:hypothetical protein